MSKKYTGNIPSNVSHDSKYHVRRSTEGWEIMVVYRLSDEEKALVTTNAHPRLVELVNGVKADYQGVPGGAFYIDEYRHVLVPTNDGCMLAGYYEADLHFRFEGREIGPRPAESIEPGQVWPGLRVGIAYTLTADGRDVRYKVETRPNVIAEMRLSKAIGAAAAARVSSRLARHKPGGGRIYINEAGEFFAPVQRDGEWIAIYLGALSGGDWFPDPVRTREST